MSVTVHHGDCLDVLRGMDEASVDSVVTDPPYGLEFMSVAWDTFSDRPKGSPRVPNTWGDHGSREHPRNATEQAHVMGKKSRAFGQWCEAWAREVYRVMKPGAHLVAFSGTRTYHRMVCAIEDAGFEIRDQLAWLYGSGFPKSLDVGKAIDKAAGAEREVVGEKRSGVGRRCREGGEIVGAAHVEALKRVPVTASATPEAARWAGWGTALKPAHEPIVLARKPLARPTVAAQVLATGTGALNVDACRVAPAEVDDWGRTAARADGTMNPGLRGDGEAKRSGHVQAPHTAGRWPANLCHDGSPEVLAAFAAFGERHAYGPYRASESKGRKVNTYGEWDGRGQGPVYADTGTAARFFYSAKASKAERAGSKHPTVKPLALMRWLCRLVTPPGGTVLDPFAGSGTTGEAALLEGFRAVLIEREAEHVADCHRRLGRASGADTPLLSETAA